MPPHDSEQEQNEPTASLETQSAVESAKTSYHEFLSANPSSSIEEITLPTGKVVAIKNPWGDESLVITIPPDTGLFEQTINNIYLPERYTAIWHRDSKDLEIIWTATPLPPIWNEIEGRIFSFAHQGKEFVCEFSSSSDRLLCLAENFEPVVASGTSFRHLQSFKIYVALTKVGHTDLSSYKPRSFWIRNVEWDEDKVLDLAKHLNFFLKYYDTLSPTILIHTPKSEINAAAPRSRYTAGNFPSRIDSRPLDDTLLALWTACHEGDSARRFLYAFRIIEYASFSFLDAAARKEIRKLLLSPNRLDDIAGLSDALVSALQKSKLEDFHKMEALLSDTVRISLLWREININLSFFTCDTVFDGGFRVNKLLSEKAKEEDFEVNGIKMFHSAIRNIRNALSHGKDQRTSFVITPTTRNFELLAPWASLVVSAASEVLLYKDVV